MNSKQKGKRGEEWKKIPGYKFYEVSNFGSIRSLPRNTTKGKILTQHINKRNGYCYVNLIENGQKKNVRVHKCVALAFLGPKKSEKIQINHLDGNKTNNNVENLEYCTGKENMQHAYKHGLEKRVGIKTICIDNMKVYETLTDAAKDISNGKANGEMVARVCRGERSHYRGFHFMFYEDFVSGKKLEYKGKFKKKGSKSLWL